ncbi:type II toxin-antitoxin system VapB family antitoxin [Paraburkholderia sp.]|uniref:type II toxin-antitoxin system VapB family antitoxin n=1 Tax=Paraburkholderia sp. TaxID=1926495 RepID=UPI003D6FADA5
MRTTVTVDDALYSRALELAEPGTSAADLFREALETFVRIQAGRRLAAPGGHAPDMAAVPRRSPAGVPDDDAR